MSAPDPISEAYIRGMEDVLLGNTNNPYPLESALSEAWEEGNADMTAERERRRKLSKDSLDNPPTL